MAEAKRIFVGHPIQDASHEQISAKADAIVDQVIAALSDQNDG